MAAVVQAVSAKDTNISLSPDISIDESVSGIMHSILKEKKTMHDASLKWNISRFIEDGVISVWGDFFNAIYAGLEIVVSLHQIFNFFTANTMFIVEGVMCVSGFIGGAINIGSGCSHIKSSIQAFVKKDYFVALRLMVTGCVLIALGLIMLLSGVGMLVSSLAGFTAFFISQPWLIPTLFFIGSILALRETSLRSKNIYEDKDFASKFKVRGLDATDRGESEVCSAAHQYIMQAPDDALEDELRAFSGKVLMDKSLILTKPENDRFRKLFEFTEFTMLELKGKLSSLEGEFGQFKEGLNCVEKGYVNTVFYKYKKELDMLLREYDDINNDGGDEEIALKRRLSGKLDKMENRMGFYLANLLFEKVANGMPDGKSAIYEGKSIKYEAKDWDKVQYSRFAQHIIYAIGFIITMLSFAFGPVGFIICSILSALGVFIGNSIALFLDVRRPFTRNAFIIIPSVMRGGKI